MTDTSEEIMELRQELSEARRAILHTAAAIHNLQLAVGASYQASFHPSASDDCMKPLQQSQLDLAEALKVLVKDNQTGDA